MLLVVTMKVYWSPLGCLQYSVTVTAPVRFIRPRKRAEGTIHPSFMFQIVGHYCGVPVDDENHAWL